jgi:hypothetical protein
MQLFTRWGAVIIFGAALLVHTRPAAAADPVYKGCIIGNEGGILWVKIDSAEILSLDLSEFQNSNGDRLDNDYCYLFVVRQGQDGKLRLLSLKTTDQEKRDERKDRDRDQDDDKGCCGLHPSVETAS